MAIRNAGQNYYLPIVNITILQSLIPSHSSDRAIPPGLKCTARWECIQSYSEIFKVLEWSFMQFVITCYMESKLCCWSTTMVGISCC